jgi:hypothetical protein
VAEVVVDYPLGQLQMLEEGLVVLAAALVIVQPQWDRAQQIRALLAVQAPLLLQLPLAEVVVAHQRLVVLDHLVMAALVVLEFIQILLALLLNGLAEAEVLVLPLAALLALVVVALEQKQLHQVLPLPMALN